MVSAIVLVETETSRIPDLADEVTWLAGFENGLN